AHADDVEVTYDSDVVVAVETEYATGLKDIVIMDEDGTTLAVDFELVKIDDNHYEVTIKGLDVGKYSINFTTQVGDDYISECTNSSKIRVNPAPSYVWGEDVDVIFGEPIVIPVESVNATGIAYQIIDGSDNVVAEGALEVGGSIKDLDLPAGEYTVKLTTVTDENHDSVSNTSNLIVRHKITVVLDPVIGYTGEYKDFHAHVFDENGNPVDGGEAVMTIVYTNRLALAISMNFLLNAADETYSASVVNGEAVFPNIKLGEPGVYPSQVLYTNDYASVKNESTVTILKLNTTVKGDDVSGKPGDSKSISVDVLDQNGNPVENGTVTLTLNGKTYNATVKNGKAVFDVVLPDPGDYEAVVKYEGNDYYNPSGSTIKVHVDKINTSPSADDVTGKKNEKKDITVNIVDENGKPVKNGTATLKIGGKSYNAEVVNGVAVFKDVELPSDDAVAEVIYHGNEYYNSSSTTFSIKIEHEKGNNESEPSNG
ncbi:MAG: Ig-like domain-containing protein, partial [Methanobrevibacter sp.]|nr:Ig-like domain-containing protein [Methanobrevibacter sp.]